METELWMNFLWAAKTLNARTVLVNGRISDKAYRMDIRVRPYFKTLFGMMDRVLAQTETDRDRLVALGARDTGGSVFPAAQVGRSDAAARLATTGAGRRVADDVVGAAAARRESSERQPNEHSSQKSELHV